MATHDRRPVVRAGDDRWQRLGELLQLRRGELGYRRRPAFTRERDINIRLVTDIENAYRPNTFLTPTLREIAQAYRVTYESVIAVLNGKEEELTPAPPAPPPGLPPAPQSELLREDAVRPYAEAVWKLLVGLIARGVRDPDGVHPSDTARWSPSGAQLGLGPEDAHVWDGSRGAMDIYDRAWLTGDIRRRREARRAAAEPGADIA